MKKYAGEEFLNKLYKDLVHSTEVKHTAKGANKNEDLAIYLERLDRINKRADSKHKLDLLKYFYYKKYIIKEENVPESYFKAQEQIALERGYGHIEYDKYRKKQEIESIIEEQKASLDRWLDYFISDDTNHYPMWFKYYVFQNVIKIGYLDKGKNEFTKRTGSTVKPFIEINREAVAMLYNELYKYLYKQKITDDELEILIKNGSFPKIYAYIINKIDKLNKNTSNSNEGIWKKYNQGSNPEILFNDIHGKGTGWCTAGGIDTATAHLNGGDFHVYYTKDEHGEYTVPRIAIRMKHVNIAEIRGVADKQNLETEMEDVVEEKLNDFPDKDRYKKKVSDMKELTKIYNKHKNREELTKEELRFLYEIDSYIIGFGYEEDPRIEEIIESRNVEKDVTIIFDSKEKTKYHYGHLNLSRLKNVEGLTLPEEIIGHLDLQNLTKAKEMIFPKIIEGYLDLRNLFSVENVVFPNEVKGCLLLSFLRYVNGIVFPTKIGGYLNLNSLTSAAGVILPKEIGGTLYLNSLTCAKDLVLPKEIAEDLYLNALTSAEGLVLPEKIGGTLYLNGLYYCDGILLPKNEKGEFYVPGNLDCLFTEEQLIEASKITEKNQKQLQKNKC